MSKKDPTPEDIAANTQILKRATLTEDWKLWEGGVALTKKQGGMKIVQVIRTADAPLQVPPEKPKTR